MIIDETVTYLEMTSRDQLLPGRSAPQDLQLQLHDLGSLPLIRSVYARIGAAHHWNGRLRWSRDEWVEKLGALGRISWMVHTDDEPIGIVELQVHEQDGVEIVVFGLVPEYVGRGYGGHALTLAARQAWSTPLFNGDSTARVWLHTSSVDHPHALGNYLARGFTIFKTEDKKRQINDPE